MQKKLNTITKKIGNDTIHLIGKKINTEIIIYIHGFAVKYDSKGLFSNLAQQLKDEYTSVLFNLSDYDRAGNCSFLALKMQQDRIFKITQYIKTQNPQANLTFIGHSMGCGVLSTIIDDLPTNTAIMLAPARDNPGPLIEKNVLQNLNGYTEKNRVHFKRKNNTITSFDKEYVNQFDIKFSYYYKKNWPNIKHLKVVLADEDLNHYSQETKMLYNSFKAIIFNECDHNFSDQNRLKLGQLLKEFFNTNK